MHEHIAQTFAWLCDRLAPVVRHRRGLFCRKMMLPLSSVPFRSRILEAFFAAHGTGEGKWVPSWDFYRQVGVRVLYSYSTAVVQRGFLCAAATIPCRQGSRASHAALSMPCCLKENGVCASAECPLVCAVHLNDPVFFSVARFARYTPLVGSGGNDLLRRSSHARVQCLCFVFAVLSSCPLVGYVVCHPGRPAAPTLCVRW